MQVDSVRLYAAKLGHTATERKIDLKAELEFITRVFAKGRTKIFVFSDEYDIAKIRGLREGQGNKSQE